MAEVLRAGEAVRRNVTSNSGWALVGVFVGNRLLDLFDARWPAWAMTPGDRAVLFTAISSSWVSWRAFVRVKAFSIGPVEFGPPREMDPESTEPEVILPPGPPSPPLRPTLNPFLFPPVPPEVPDGRP